MVVATVIFSSFLFVCWFLVSLQKVLHYIGFIYFVMFFFLFALQSLRLLLLSFCFSPLSFLLGGGCRGAVYSTFLLLHVSAEGLIYILIYMTEKTFDG